MLPSAANYLAKVYYRYLLQRTLLPTLHCKKKLVTAVPTAINNESFYMCIKETGGAERILPMCGPLPIPADDEVRIKTAAIGVIFYILCSSITIITIV